MTSANAILSDAEKTIGQRATDYDKPEGERSVAHCVRIFNAITGRNLTEFEGWLFMDALKTARMMANPKKLDTHVDKAAYAALAGECALAAKLDEEFEHPEYTRFVAPAISPNDAAAGERYLRDVVDRATQAVIGKLRDLRRRGLAL